MAKEISFLFLVFPGNSNWSFDNFLQWFLIRKKRHFIMNEKKVLGKFMIKFSALSKISR
jgi:hypothetical protein